MLDAIVHQETGAAGQVWQRWLKDLLAPVRARQELRRAGFRAEVDKRNGDRDGIGWKLPVQIRIVVEEFAMVAVRVLLAGARERDYAGQAIDEKIFGQEMAKDL